MSQVDKLNQLKNKLKSAYKAEPTVKHLSKAILNESGAEEIGSHCVDDLPMYVDAEVAGIAVGSLYPQIKQHLDLCASCGAQYVELLQMTIDEIEGRSEGASDVPRFDLSFLPKLSRDESAPQRAQLGASKREAKKPSAKRLSLRLPEFIAMPVAALGVRGITPDQTEQSFHDPVLKARITVRISPPVRERRQIEGFVTQDHKPIAAVRVALRATQVRSRSSQTDESGFFSFRKLPIGDYRLEVHLMEGILVIPSLILQED